MTPALIFSIAAFCLILIKSADFVIVGLRRLGKSTKTAVFALSAIILALGTSLPELFVGITSAIENTPNLILGVVLGSNIANIALVCGFMSLITGRIIVRGAVLRRDIIVAFLAGIIPMILLLDGKLGRVDGLILLSVYFAYTTSFFKKRYEEIAEEHRKESFFYRFFRRFNYIDASRRRESGRLFVGIALLLFSADMIVRLSRMVAESAGIPVFIIGLLVLAVGTSLPELAFSLRSLEDNESSMFFGNLLGSLIANSTLIIGFTSLINPIEVVAVDQYLKSAIFFVVIFLTFAFFVDSKKRLDRWEGLVLLLMYLLFAIVQFV